VVIDFQAREAYFRSGMPKKKNPAAVALGKLGGSKVAKARAARLTPSKEVKSPERRLMARWAKAAKGRGSNPNEPSRRATDRFHKSWIESRRGGNQHNEE